MKTNTFCPISNKKTDENIARFNGLITVVLLSVFIVTENLIPVVFLLVDFLLRGLELSNYSILTRISKNIISLFKIKPLIINAGPKIFAARIGVLFSFLILFFSIIDLSYLSLIFAIIFGVCAFLEAAFAICVACIIYPYVYKFTFQSKITKLNV